MDQDRDFYITWCALLSGDAETYFQKMQDEELEAKYHELLGQVSQEIEAERS